LDRKVRAGSSPAIGTKNLQRGKASGLDPEAFFSARRPAASVPEAQEDPINAQVLSLEEFLRLIKAAEKALQPVLALQGFAGLRRSEVEQIEWDNIKFDTERIVPTKTKSGKWR